MATHEIGIHPTKPLAEEPGTGHNRWHPDIPAVVTVQPGDEVVLHTRDALDGQITRSSTAADVANLDISLVHPLTGPVHVAGAEPGDLLEVEMLEVTTGSFGFTVQSPGFGFLREDFSEPFLARWDIADGLATSPDVPGVAIPGHPFMGTMGVAPSRELLDRALAREQVLSDAGGFVDLPEPRGAVPNTAAIATEALRTIPPRENAGNIDIKQLTAGTTLRIPVGVEGALLSVGDAHFAQGDCETCGQAIEVRAVLRARLTLRTRNDLAGPVHGVHFERSTPTADTGPYYATTGICIDRDGTNRSEDLTLAARNALRAMIVHLTSEYGYTPAQAYTICSVAVDLKVSQVVDVPNVLVSAFLPLGIFP
jgi:formamidase